LERARSIELLDHAQIILLGASLMTGVCFALSKSIENSAHVMP
jgi:hypothetical protein